jgi:surface antigen
MKPNLVLATLGVSATLLLGNSPALDITNNSPSTQTVQKPEVKASDVKAQAPAEVPPAPQPPVDKVVTVQKGDTLQKIATANNTTYVRLYNANPSIANPDAIETGEQITIPADDKQLEDRFSQLASSAPVEPVAPTHTVPHATHRSSGISNSSRNHSGWWCTDYVHSRRPDVPIYGNAGYSWITAAKADGKATGSTPQAGAIAVMPGHVAYVESVNADGSYVVSEMGWNYKAGSYNIRTVQPGAFGAFIY